MSDYIRHDFQLEVFGSNNEAIFRQTNPAGSKVETSLPREVADRATHGDDADLRAALVRASVLAPLPSMRADYASFDLTRVTIALNERSWSAIAWESFAPPTVCFVRVSDVRPRVRQIPFSFPMRILEAGGTPIVTESLSTIFGDSNRSMAIVESSTTLGGVPHFPKAHGWPTVEVLHLRDLGMTESARPALLKWLQRFVEAYQTRLIIFECLPTYLRQARRVAQTVVERGGPAVWLFEPWFAQWGEFYGHVVHDRPLDWMRSILSAGELFAGAGREELLRYSSLAAAFDRKAVIEAISSEIASSAGRGRAGKATNRPIAQSVHEAVVTSAKSLRIPTTGSILDFNYVPQPKTIRFGAAITTYLMQRGVHAPHVDKVFGALRSVRQDIDITELARGIGRGAQTVQSFDRPAAAAAITRKLRAIAAIRPELRFEDHESEGMLPLAAKVVDARTLLNAVRGKKAKRSRPPRHVNAAFFREDKDGQLKRLPQTAARLRPGELVHFGVQIGEKDRLLVNLGSLALIEEIDRLPKGTSIEIGVTAIDFDLLGDPVQHLWLPAGKAGKPTDLVTFAVRPRKATIVPGIARLRFSVFHDNNVVQSFLVAAVLEGGPSNVTSGLASALHVPVADVKSAGKVGYLTRLEYSAAPVTEVEVTEPRALTIIANESAGEKVITIKGEELFHVTNDPNLPDSVKRAREALDRASVDTAKLYRYMYMQNANAGNPEDLCDTMWDVASAGWEIYNLLIQGRPAQDLVRERLKVGGGIHAAHIDASTVIPWSLVYDRKVYDRKTFADPSNAATPALKVERAFCRASMPPPDGTMPDVECGSVPGCLLHPSENDRRKAANRPIVCEETVICPRRFWGFMVPIEVPAQQVAGVAGTPPPPIKKKIAATKPLAFVAGLNPNLNFAGRHKSHLTALVDKQQATFRTPGRAGRDAVFDLLEQVEPDVVYFFCHAIATLTAANGRSVGPSLDFGHGFEGVVEDVLEAADFAGKDWTHAPLVFMNGCSSTGFSPYAPSKFIKQFIQGRKAAAVIGTEVTVWEVLAEEFAVAFFQEFLGRKGAGEALLRSRRSLLSKDNPLGLVYTLYGSTELKIEDGG